MKRGVLVYAVALAVALGGAYWAWQNPEDPTLAERVVILPGETEDIEQIVYEDDESTVTLEVREDERGTYPWGKVVPKPSEKQEPDPANPHAPPPRSDEPSEFKGGKGAETIIEALAPFTAKRVLEGVDDFKLDELGLEDPDATMTIHREGREPKTYEIGGSVYGGANVYVRDPGTGTVYIVEAQKLRSLQAAERTLPERDLVGIPLDDIARITVRRDDAEAAFKQHNLDDADARFWSVAGSEEANPAAASWLDKALRLRATGYVQGDERPEALSEAFRFTVEPLEGDPVTVVVFRKVGEGDQEQWYASSEHTRGMVKIGRALAVEVEADLQSALDAAQAS